ncbi:MGMT family protein [Megasphaera sueciensis]
MGMANNKNPILLVTPCYRVIGVNGKLWDMQPVWILRKNY